LILLNHAGRDTPALADRDAAVFGPGADVGAAVAAGRRAGRAARRSAPGLAGVPDERRQLLPECGGVLGAQVDLIVRPAEPNRTV
jgi:hypothetical protein